MDVATADRPDRTTRNGARAANDTAMPIYLTGVQGLRTVAALLVAIYHIWFDRVSGGVDVFFVVAGYFTAKSVLKMRYSESFGGRAKVVGRYWLHTLRRITPSAVVVIVATVVASVLFMPKNQWIYAVGHGFASLLHFENWQLIWAGADYLQDGVDVSPFQQFWALSLQVQFYLFFPFVLFVALILAKRFGWSDKLAAIVMVLIVLVPSFAFSVFYTAADQQAAYFNTFARGWEFMIGSLLFLLLTRGLANKALAGVMGWAGLVMLVCLGATVDLSTKMPGAVALIPVAAAVLIIVSAASNAEPVVLKWKPIVWFANSSFAFYLWHWPVLTMYRYQFGEEVGLRGGIAILVVSAVLAYITTRSFEDPIRTSKRLVNSTVGTLVTVALLMGVAGGALAYWQQKLTAEERAEAALVDSVIEGDALPEGTMIPSTATARQDLVVTYDLGCHQRGSEAEVLTCILGDENAEKTVALVGGSRSGQWSDLVTQAAEAAGAKVMTVSKSRCRFGDIEMLGLNRHESCAIWSQAALDMLIETKPDVVVVMATIGTGGVDDLPDGYAVYFQALSDAGVRVVGIQDNPRFKVDVPACIEEKSVEECSEPKDKFFDEDKTLDFSSFNGFDYVEMSDLYCPDGMCSVVQDGVLMYRDKTHLTRTWTMRNGERVEQAIADALAAGPVQ